MMYSAPFLLLPFFAAQQTPPATAADQLVQLAKEGAAIHAQFHAALEEAGHDRPRVTAANEKYRTDSMAWAKRASALLKAHPAEPGILDVIVTMNEIYYVDDETVAILREHHFGAQRSSRYSTASLRTPRARGGSLRRMWLTGTQTELCVARRP